MLIFIAFILFILVVLALNNKKKPKYKPVPIKNRPALAPVPSKTIIPAVNQTAIDLATKHFGWEWFEFLAARNLKVNVSVEKIRQGIAIGYSKMGNKPLENLLVSFIQVNPDIEGNPINATVTTNNYRSLHLSVYDLIRANRFNPDGIQTMLGVLSESASIQRENILNEQVSKLSELKAKKAEEKTLQAELKAKHSEELEKDAELKIQYAKQGNIVKEKERELQAKQVELKTQFVEQSNIVREKEQGLKELVVQQHREFDSDELALKISDHPSIDHPEIVETPQVDELLNLQDDSVIEVSAYSERIDLPPVNISTEIGSTALERTVYPEYDPDTYSLGKKYKQKLNLSAQEAKWLNKFWNHSNVFNAISGCEIEIVKLFLLSMKRLNKKLKAEGSTLDQEIAPLKTMTLDFERSQEQYWYGYDEIHAGDSAESETYYFTYKMAEMVIREQWNHKRKISASFYSRSPEIKEKFDQRLGAMIEEIVTVLIPTIGQPDEETEIALNEATTTRWKIYFEKITTAAPNSDHSETFAALHRLGKLNKRNPSVEHVYYEASKFAATIDKTESLKFYLYYVWKDLNSEVIDNKQLNKTIQKKLFSNEDQLNTFQTIINDLVSSRNFALALKEVENVYKAKRKTIKLNSEAIRRVQDQHSGTVDKLNEYLQDDDEVLQITIPKAVTQENVIPAATSSIEVSQTGIALENFQRECLQLFVNNDYSLPAADIEIFAKGKSMFKNQLIDGINEQCYELLDDMLIEETEDGYEINPDYYQKLLA